MDRRRLYGLALLAFITAMLIAVSAGMAEVAVHTPDLVYVTPSPAAVEATSPITFAAAVPKEPTPVARRSVQLPTSERAPVKPATGVGSERWRPLVERFFPASAVDEALLCIHLESRGNPNAVSGQYVGCGGLTQTALAS